MGNIPLHAMVVQLPMGLSVLLPVLLAALAIAIGRGKLPAGAWWVGVIAVAIAAGGALLSNATGWSEETRLAAAVAEAPLRAHEHAAERFAGATQAALLVALIASLVPVGRVRAGVYGVAAFASAVALAFGVHTAVLGWQLVYRHGAACVSAQGKPGTPAHGEPEPDLTPVADEDDAR